MYSIPCFIAYPKRLLLRDGGSGGTLFPLFSPQHEALLGKGWRRVKGNLTPSVLKF